LGKEKKLRRLMLLLGLLAAMMLAASPVLAWQPGPHEGNKYSKNYYPTVYFNYCEPDGSRYYGDKRASNPKWCDHYYTEYKTKWTNGKKWYWVHVYYKWKTPSGQSHKKDYWYYCQYHKYNDPNSTHPYFKAWVTYKPTGKHYWESFFWHS
jgi:hypothetical protein